MTIGYPTTLDTLPQPTATTTEDQTGFEHDIVHSNVALAVMALEAKVGVDASAVATSLDYRVTALESGASGIGRATGLTFASLRG